MTNKARAWMPLFVADYLADTGRLTTEMHGAYLLLLMEYWRSGEPLPDCDLQLSAITRLAEKQWARLRPVLSRFFKVGDGVWWHKRVDEELREAARLAEVRAERSRKGVAARSKTAPEVEPQVEPRVTPEVQPETLLHSHSQVSETSSDTLLVAPAEKLTLGKRLPESWSPSPQDEAFAASCGLDADEVAAEFRDYWRSVPGAKGRKLDWSATFRNSCRMKARPKHGANNRSSVRSEADRTADRRAGFALAVADLEGR